MIPEVRASLFDASEVTLEGVVTSFDGEVYTVEASVVGQYYTVFEIEWRDMPQTEAGLSPENGDRVRVRLR